MVYVFSHNYFDRFCLLACVIRAVITWCMYLVITIFYVNICNHQVTSHQGDFKFIYIYIFIFVRAAEGWGLHSLHGFSVMSSFVILMLSNASW